MPTLDLEPVDLDLEPIEEPSTPRYNDELIAALPEREQKKLELASELAAERGRGEVATAEAEDLTRQESNISFFAHPSNILNQPGRIMAKLGGVYDTYEDPIKGPLMKFSVPEEDRSVIAGVGRSSAKFLTGMTDPDELMKLPAFGGGAVAKLLAFLPMVKDLPEQAAHAADVLRNSQATPAEKAEAITDPTLASLMMTLGAKGSKSPTMPESLRGQIGRETQTLPELPPEIRITIEQAKDTGLNKSAAAAEEAVVKGQNAVQEQTANEGVLREARSEVELQGVEQPHELQKPAEVLPQEEVRPRLVAAIRSPSGKIYTGERHPFALANAMDEIRGTGGTRAGEMAAELADAEQGFVDVSTGRFLTRSEAAKQMGATGELTSEQIPESELKANLAQYQSLKELRELPGTATTQEAMALGAKVPKESIPQLEALAKAAGEEAQKVIAEVDAMSNPTAEDLTRMSVAGNKAQLLNEAVEAAKGGKPAILAREASAAKTTEPELVSMGGATPSSLPARPTIGEVIPPRPATGLPPSVPPTPAPPSPPAPPATPFFQRLRQSITGTIGTMAGKTLPRITQLGKQAGEAGARYISSAIAARPMANLFARDVTTGLDIDPIKLGAALSEDNLRSIEGSTFSFVGKDKPFATEAEYQAYLKEPGVQEAIKRHISNWENVIEPMFREAQQIDPSVTLPTRGKQTGARVNLAAIMEGEPVPPGTVYSSGRGNILNTLRKKSPFGVKATGTGEAYAANYNDIIANSFHKQLEIANKNAFDNALVEQGLAVIDDPGQHPVLGGEETVGFPLKRKTIVVPEQGAFSQNKTIYVRKSIAREYRNASNLDDNPYRDFITTRVANAANQAALAGLTDATVHVTNLSTGLAQLPVSTLHPIADAFLSAAGRLDIPVAGAKVIAKGAPEIARAVLQKSKLLQKITPDVVVKSIEDAFWKNQTQLAELAEIGAMKGQHGSSGLPVMRQMSDVIQWYDRSTRAVLDDAYQDLAARGIVENSETARREFVNQVGQYNKRAQGAIVRLSRDLGTGPFVTAGRAFNVLGVKGATLNPGVKATSVPNAVLLRANMAAKWMGTFAFVALANYLLTGKTGGRPGTPIGSIDSGKNDEQGRMKSFSVINLTGQGRALRVTGLRGSLEAKQKGLPTAVAADSAERDLVNSWVAPFAGPIIKAGFVAASGYPPAIKVGRASKVVPPGQSQTVEDVKTAVEDANPIVAGIVKSQEPGRTWEELVKTQLPRFTMQTKQPEKMIADYPTIVRRAQANAFMEDVIHRARYIERTDDRKKYIRESLDKLDRSDRPHAELMLRFRKISY